jgi:hypothetical protein
MRGEPAGSTSTRVARVVWTLPAQPRKKVRAASLRSTGRARSRKLDGRSRYGVQSTRLVPGFPGDLDGTDFVREIWKPRISMR